MAEDATLAISRFPGLYSVDTAQTPFARAPFATAGMPRDRQPDAPPGTTVDVESQLTNRYDILGKYGLVHLTGDAESELLRQARQQTIPGPPPTNPPADAFFTRIDDRIPKSACDPTPSYYRLDPNPPAMVTRILSEPQRGGAATRLNAKDAYDAECQRGA